MNEVINHCVTGLNGAGRVFCDYAAGVLIQLAVLVVVLLIADLLLRKRVRAVVRYCVWLLVLVKLILPPTLALPTGIGYWLGDRLSAVFPVADRGAQLTGFEPAGQPPSPRSPLSGDTLQVQPPTRASATDASLVPPAAGITPVTRQGLLFFLWLVGVLVFAALLVQRVRFVRGLIAFSLPADGRFQHLAEECGTQMGIRRKIELRVSGTMSSPALCGLLRPVVLVPARILETLPPEGLQAILIHELAHLKRGDVWVNTLQTVLQVIHFYNPFVWLANAMIRRTREEAVDETVLVALGGQAENYSNTLIDIGELALWKADLGLRLIGVAESERILRWRIQHMLTRPVPKSARIGMLGAAVLVITAALLLPMARAEKAAVVTQPSGAETPPKAPVAGDSNVFTDPNTGIRFTKFKALSGPSDIKNPRFVRVSPSGNFLLNGVRVVPLDDSAPFDLVDMPGAGGQGSLSPDGRKVVFFCDDALWWIEINPDTGRPLGSPRKLLDKQSYITGGWSRDSQRITFLRADSQPGDARVYSWWTLSMEGGEPSPLMDPYSFGLLSPDGKTVAYEAQASADVYSRSSTLLARPVVGGEARKVLDGKSALSPAAWSGDSEWLVSGVWRGLEFVRIADGRHVEVTTPGSLIGGHQLGKKLLFYERSYESTISVKLLSVAGGAPAKIGWPSLSFRGGPGNPWWAQDSRSILVEGTRGEDQWGLWAVPLDGKDLRPLAIDSPLCRNAQIRLLSRDGSHLLLVTGELRGNWDLWTVPISLAQMRSTGPAVKIFGGMVPPVRTWQAVQDSWSPDGSKIVFVHNWDIWVADAEGKNVLQLTKTPEMEGLPIWSPDGKMIVFRTQPSGSTQVGAQTIHLRLHVVPASGGEARVIADLTCASVSGLSRYTWFPDGKEVTVACDEDGIIANFPIAGGDRRTVVRLKDVGIDLVSWPRWSPDGRLLAFQGRGERGDWKFYVYQVDNAKLQPLSDDYVPPFYWSPDSRWICYYTREPVKTRPEDVLWEMDVDEAVAKLAK